MHVGVALLDRCKTATPKVNEGPVYHNVFLEVGGVGIIYFAIHSLGTKMHGI